MGGVAIGGGISIVGVSYVLWLGLVVMVFRV
jgi:hypothetical protein